MAKLVLNVISNDDDNEKDRLISYGPPDMEIRPVYRLSEDPHLHVLLPIKFPSCIRFMPYCIVGGDELVEMEEIEKRFGPVFDPISDME